MSNPFEDPVASRPPFQQQQHTGAQYPRPQGIINYLPSMIMILPSVICLMSQQYFLYYPQLFF